MSSNGEEKSPEALLDEARHWWETSIIDIHPGVIRVRGYPIQDLIGEVSFPEMIWLMLMGELPNPTQSSLLEAALVSSVDHGPQAPSIAIARMAATCGPDLNGSMASGINVLDDIHGGAGQQCMRLYYEIQQEASELGVPEAANAVTARWKAAGVKYMPGFGHRFHPIDPRAGRLLGLIDQASQADDRISGDFAEIGRAVVDAISAGLPKPIPMNIDGATAAIYCELGLPYQLGRGVFILSRSVGILAHAWEQMQQGGRIKGPQAKFLNYTYTGMEERPVPDASER